MGRREAFIRLNGTAGLGPVTIHRLLAAFGSPQEVFRAERPRLKEVLGRWGAEEVLDRILDPAGDEHALREIRRCEYAGVRLLTLADEEYPELLKRIPDPPPVLYVKGTLLPEDSAAVAIVGTRAATLYGTTVARQIAADLARSGITVVSGLAEGIDAAGHEAALDAGGRALAVLGHGLRFLYPEHHSTLASRVEKSGALVSEFPFETRPQPSLFPQRNRLIAGLSLGVLVVEAPERSGALITAREALDQGREVFAVPGPVSSPKSRGTNRLIRDGARLVESASDILEELTPALQERLRRWKETVPQPAAAPRMALEVHLPQEAQALREAIPAGSAAGVETLVRATSLEPARVLALLTELEIKGLIKQVPGQGYSRA